MFYKKLDWAYGLFRIVLGVLFFLHGYAKLFGWMGNPGTDSVLMLVVGVGEILAGAGLALGILSRVAATGGFVIMLGALITVHQFGDVIAAGNERAWMYLFSFLLIMSMGNGNWALEKKVTGRKKELV